MKKIAIGVLIVGALGYLFYLGVRAQIPKGADMSIAYADQGRTHIQVGSAHPEYNSNPPSSGWHYSNPADPGFYAEAVADEYVVHNLEHGDVWIAYHPRVGADMIQKLRTFATVWTVITPREANTTDIALVAWGHMDAFNTMNGALDETRVHDFIARYKNRGPEKVPVADHVQK
ncbi:MAG: DUF3105 domain-containing protein [Candidatus Lloydbacteria bacterium]|nr:DUF3105 domain-containing protein [Candidatus Lloydbacteria bacterium]